MQHAGEPPRQRLANRDARSAYGFTNLGCQGSDSTQEPTLVTACFSETVPHGYMT